MSCERREEARTGHAGRWSGGRTPQQGMGREQPRSPSHDSSLACPLLLGCLVIIISQIKVFLLRIRADKFDGCNLP